jgi:hypothetical protein
VIAAMTAKADLMVAILYHARTCHS